MTTPANWPNPERPGVPVFADRSGKHVVGGKLLFWYSDIQKWVTSSPIRATKEPSDFTECEYHGPVLTPTQITDMLAGERERVAKEIEVLEDNWMGASDGNNALQDAIGIIRNLGAAP